MSDYEDNDLSDPPLWVTTLIAVALIAAIVAAWRWL